MKPQPSYRSLKNEQQHFGIKWRKVQIHSEEGQAQETETESARA